MNKLVVGVNTAMFDGLDADVAFYSIREAGFHYVELAYNQGYAGNLSPALFSENNARYIRDMLDKHQLRTQAMGATMNLGAQDAVAQFTQRIRFAAMIGATFLPACIGKKADRQRIVANLKMLAPIANDHQCVICIENGGDPDNDVFRLAEDGFALLEEINSPAVAFNVDAGNIVSLCSGTNAIEEAIAMLPGSRYCHIKDVLKRHGEYFFPAIGKGELDYRPLLKVLEMHSIPCSLEIPLRMHRQRDTYPHRAAEPVSPETSLLVLRQSREALERWLGYPL
ncbi:sugar phosphate isomerase/epimerase family protein [Erwinia piriflorinigrans]|uniref:Xylose isomerase domain-containing protein n=1 Tax=Erwinia piriflorinigrans CFBP 5888 TaxID=1161919 RepID=V5Z504_9GAMM|nr:sugar phosphate isomerase/epimerase family protein [Erwinia piriflorinigrans]CCG86084.1 xylose isomerase domain-containing protein [Erwinia piriflorinigrans CFBP 5888]